MFVFNVNKNLDNPSLKRSPTLTAISISSTELQCCDIISDAIPMNVDKGAAINLVRVRYIKNKERK